MGICGIGACAGSCLGSCASATLCQACKGCSPSSNNNRYHYTFLTMLACIFAIVLQQFGDYNIINNTKICSLIDVSRCAKNASVLRIFTVLSLLFGCHVIMVRAWKSFHKYFWLIKLLVFSLLVVACYFIPNHLFESYAEFARIGAGIFLVFQIVVLINMLYDWNEAWLSKQWFTQILVASAIMYVIAGVFYGLGFHFYGATGCSRNIGNLIASVLMSFCLSVLSVFTSHGAILPASGVTLYLSWMLLSSLSHDPDRYCNSAGANNRMQPYIGLMIMCVAVGYFCVANSRIQSTDQKDIAEDEDSDGISYSEDDVPKQQNKNESSNNLETEINHVDKADSVEDITSIKILGSDDDEITEKKHPTKTGNDDIQHDDVTCVGKLCSPSDAVQSKNVVFHILMAFGSMFIMMCLTNWDTVATNDGGNAPKRDSSVLIGIISHWVVVSLYAVTLIAPLICPRRFALLYSDSSDEEA